MLGWTGAEWPVNQSACALSGVYLAVSYPYDLRSVACRKGGAWSGRVDKSIATQRGQGAAGRVAGSAQGP